MCLVLFWHSSCPNCMLQSLTQPCMCSLEVLFPSLSVYVYEEGCSNHVLWCLILTPAICQQISLTPGFISGVDYRLSDSMSAHGSTGSLLISFMGTNVTFWCKSSLVGAQEVVYCWCPDMDEEISGLSSQHPIASLRAWQFHSQCANYIWNSLSVVLTSLII